MYIDYINIPSTRPILLRDFLARIPSQFISICLAYFLSPTNKSTY